MYGPNLKILFLKFLDGWTEWDEWSPCKVTCGIGQSGLNFKKFAPFLITNIDSSINNNLSFWYQSRTGRKTSSFEASKFFF